MDFDRAAKFPLFISTYFSCGGMVFLEGSVGICVACSNGMQTIWNQEHHLEGHHAYQVAATALLVLDAQGCFKTVGYNTSR